MTVQSIFRTTAGALRAPWRILVFLAVSTFATSLVGYVLGGVLTRAFDAAGAGTMGRDETLLVVGLLIGTAFSLRFVDRRPWSDVWMGREAASPYRLIVGFFLGALAIAVPTAILILGGWLREAASTPGSWWTATARMSLTLIPAALFEELLFRGYILSVLRGAWGWVGAVVCTSIVFGLVHAQNPGAKSGFLIIVTLAGVYLAAVLIATRSLYAAWMAHFAWNWTMAALFHVAVSGSPFEAPSYRYVDAGPDWATGGAWGPEGGIPAVLGMAGSVLFLLAMRRRDPKTLTPAGRSSTHRNDNQES